MSRNQLLSITFKAAIIALIIQAGWRPGQPNTQAPTEQLPSETGYHFYIAGHIYGHLKTDGYPMHFVHVVPNLTRSKPEFMVLLGDMVKKATVENYDALRTLLSSIPFTVHSVPGNHDTGKDPNLYTKYLGKKYYSFRKDDTLFLLIDSTDEKGVLSNKQKQFIRANVEQATNDASIKHVFVFSHHLLWIIDHPRLRPIASRIHSTEYYQTSTAQFYELFVQRALEDTDTNYYFISGDVGKGKSIPVLYEEEGNITYIASGIGDKPRDHILRVNMESTTPEFVIIPLGGEQYEDISTYTMEYWRQN